jgi:hypothetical protein
VYIQRDTSVLLSTPYQCRLVRLGRQVALHAPAGSESKMIQVLSSLSEDWASNRYWFETAVLSADRLCLSTPSVGRADPYSRNAFQPHLADDSLVDHRWFRATHRIGVVVGDLHQILWLQPQLLEVRLVVSEESLVGLSLGNFVDFREGLVDQRLILWQLSNNVRRIGLNRQGRVGMDEEAFVGEEDDDGSTITTSSCCAPLSVLASVEYMSFADYLRLDEHIVQHPREDLVE